MIYIEDEDKQNIHPNIMVNNKKVQFTDKLKRYPNTTNIGSQSSSLQVSSSKQGSLIKSKQRSSIKSKRNNTNKINKNNEPEISYFQIDELKNLSQQISLKDVSCITSRKSNILMKQNSKKWTKSIMQPSKGQIRLLQKIDQMLQKQTFKPVYSTISRHNKAYTFNTMASQGKSNSQNGSNLLKSDMNLKQNSPQGNNRTSTLSQLINLSRLQSLSNKTLQKYLLCLERQKNSNELQKSHKVSEFNLLDTQRSKQIRFDKKVGHILHIQKVSNKEYDRIEKQIREIYIIIQQKQSRNINMLNISVIQMIQKINKFVRQKISQKQQIYKFPKKQYLPNEQQSTCLLQG